jgi:hypothetical protein
VKKREENKIQQLLLFDIKKNETQKSISIFHIILLFLFIINYILYKKKHILRKNNQTNNSIQFK